MIQQMAELQLQVKERQDELMPRKKFAFKSRKKEAAGSTTQSSKVKDVSSQVVTTLSQQTKLGFMNKTHETLSMGVSKCSLSS